MNTELIKSECIRKWENGFGVDKRIAYFSDTFEAWFEQIPDSDKQTVLILIENLKYYSHKAVNQWLQKLHGELQVCNNVTDENTIYAFIKSPDGKSNSSNDYWTEYKSINDINKELCYENIDAILDEQWEYIDNIVFIDDFSGSGDSFITELEKTPQRYKHKNVFFIAISIMEFGKKRIEEFAHNNDINITLFVAERQKKAFESSLFDNDNEAKKNICAMSENFKIPKYAQCGYKDSQSLIVFYNNTPNNTLGFIRYDTDKYKSIFPRQNDPKPKWQNIKKAKELRNRANYNNKVGG